MAHLRRLCALVLCFSVSGVPAWGAGPGALGTVITAQRANIGTAAATVGTTVYSGDKITTDKVGTIQLRTKAARFQLSQASSASLSETGEIPTANLTGGTAVFSTANSKAFLLKASVAEIRPQTDEPTIAQVSVVNAKELIVRSTRGALTITVDDESKTIAEGSAYRVVIDPDESTLAAAAAAAPPQGPRGAGAKGSGGPPLKAGRSRFVLFAIIVTGVGAAIALHEALESPDRP